MPAHLIAVVTRVKDAEAYREYVRQAGPLAVAAGGHPIAAGPVARRFVGDLDASAVAVIQFPDIGAVEEWYESETYQALIPIRDAAADLTILTIAEP